jgi:hypothetical protein
MTETRGKSNLEKYNDAVVLLAEENGKYNAMTKKDGKQAENKLAKIAKVQAEIAELEPIKDKYELSDTCKSYLIQAYVLSKYGRVQEVKTKQMVKGTLTEEEAIDLLAVLDKRSYIKNTDRIRNEYISGTPDLFDGDNILNSGEIIDIKSCWDIFTFLKNVQEPENDMYYWQIQGYMALTGAKIGTIAYCLVNTPDSIIEGEKYNLLRRMDVATEEDPSYKKEVELLMANRKFDDIPMAERLLTYSVDRNDEDIERIYQRVSLCRQFLGEFEETHLMFSKNYRKSLKFA